MANAQSSSAAWRVQLGVTVLPIWVMSRVRPFRVAAPMKVFRAPVVYPFLMPIVPGYFCSSVLWFWISNGGKTFPLRSVAPGNVYVLVAATCRYAGSCITARPNSARS